MNRASLITRLQSQLVNNAGNKLKPEHYEAALDAALERFSIDVVHQKSSTLEIIADVKQYDMPADLLELTWHDWKFPGFIGYAPISTGYPDLRSVKTEMGCKIEFYPIAPTVQQIDLLGKTVNYHYRAPHYLPLDSADANPSTIPDRLSAAFEILSMAYLMLQLSNMDIVSPVQLHNGMGDMQQPRTAIDQHSTLIKHYKTIINGN